MTLEMKIARAAKEVACYAYKMAIEALKKELQKLNISFNEVKSAAIAALKKAQAELEREPDTRSWTPRSFGCRKRGGVRA